MRWRPQITIREKKNNLDLVRGEDQKIASWKKKEDERKNVLRKLQQEEKPKKKRKSRGDEWGRTRGIRRCPSIGEARKNGS